MNKKYTTEEIVNKAKQIHGDKYDYSKIEYTGIFNKIIVVCPEHGEFEITPNNFINHKKGCRRCGHIKQWDKKGRTSTVDYIEKAKKVHGDKYDYSKVNYKGTHEKICIICPEHGEFWQQAANHLLGNGCPKCSKEVYNTETFINKSKNVHGDLYDYSKSKFISSQVKTIVTCSKHGDFLVTPNNHLSGKGCPICKESILEKRTRGFLLKNKINFIYRANKTIFTWLEKQHLDFYLPDHNIAIECQGIQHFEPVDFFNGTIGFNDTVNRDKIKKQLCEKNNVKLFYINYDENVELKLNNLIKKQTLEDKL